MKPHEYIVYQNLIQQSAESAENLTDDQALIVASVYGVVILFLIFLFLYLWHKDKF